MEENRRIFFCMWMFWSAIKFIYKLTHFLNAPPDTCFILSTDCWASRAELREIISMEGHICATFRNYQMEAFKWTDLHNGFICSWWLPTSIYCIFFRFWTQSMHLSVNHFRFSPFISGWQEDVHNTLLDQWHGKASLITKFSLFLGQTWHMRESHISISNFTLHNLHLSTSVHQMCPSTNSTSLITDRDTSALTSPRSWTIASKRKH